MRTRREIALLLELEYEHIRRRNEIKSKKRKADFYKKYPYIKKIDDDISNIYLSILKSSIDNDINKSLYSEIEDLKKQKQKYIHENNIDISVLEILYNCNYCKDTGYISKNGKSSRCQCYINRYNFIVYEDSNILKLVSECNFDKFDIDIFDNEVKYGKLTQRDFMEKIKNKSLSFIDKFDDIKEKSMLFYGPVGVGKSYLCLCIAERLIKKRKSVVYESSTSLFEKLAKYVFSQDKSDDSNTFNLLVYNCDLLIIDDIGSEMTNDFVKNQLFNIVNIRAINSKKTIISSNLNQDQLQERYEQRTFSRISRYYNSYKFIGRDLRMPKKIS